MTNREAYNKYIRSQTERSLRAVEGLSNPVFFLWQKEFEDAKVCVNIGRELKWFYFTYGGREYGGGIDNVVRWMDSEFKWDIEAEYAKWTEYDGHWCDVITQKFDYAKEIEERQKDGD